jgi:hypothetical protein
MTQTQYAPDPVRSPSVLRCCVAAAGLVRGLVRPRRPDERFIRNIVDAGLPDPGCPRTGVTSNAERPVHRAAHPAENY